MKVVILCGGFGTRIRDVAQDVPKPMIPIGQNPILWHIMRHYDYFGFKDFVLCLGYKSASIKEFFANYMLNSRDVTVTLGSAPNIDYHSDGFEGVEDWRVTLADTGLYTMTGGRVARVKRYLDGERDFMLTYGDGLSDIDLEALVRFHKSHGRIATVTGVRPPGRFGELEVGADNAVTGFNEKPQVSGGFISGGFFVFSSRIFEYLPDSSDLVLEQVPMQALVRDQELRVFEHLGFWHPMDTYRDFKYLSDQWESGQAPWVRSR
jgi:glucose-1-phosphate cytidylyltransferase